MSSVLAVVGPGVLGRSFAAAAAQKGIEVRLAGRDGNHSRRALSWIEQALRRTHGKGLLSTEGLAEALALILPCQGWEEALEGADWVLEALPEDAAIKARAWQGIHRLAPGKALRLSGTSSLPISRLAEAAGMVGELLGFHPFVPVDRMGLVELVVPPAVEDPKVQSALALAERLALTAVRVADVPGFAASRMALAQGLEAMRLLEAGVATAADLDTLMVKGYGHPVGPLALSDHVGLDLRLAIAENLFEATANPAFQPPALLRSLVAQGRTGKKAGWGFHRWPQP